MLEPIMQLTQEDKNTIKDFIYQYVDSEVSDVDDILKYWNKNKKTIWKALGKNLRVKIPIELTKNNKVKQMLLKSIYEPFFILNSETFRKAEEAEKNTETFINNFFVYFYSLLKKKLISFSDLRAINWILAYGNVLSGYINKIEYQSFALDKDSYTFHYKNKTLTIKNGAKTVKTLQKVLNFFEYPRTDLFEIFRNKLSDLTTATKIKSTLVFSIHPIDFMTMSDNNCNWSSCMSFVKNGGYSAGVIEMMNSNIVLLAYLESNSKYIFNEHIIPNKSWRTLIYLHKNILMVGNHYPFTNEDLSYYILKVLSKMVKKNLNWSYQFKNQTYKDLRPFYDEEDLQYSMDKKCNAHSIIIYTDAMYNDLVAYNDLSYLCYRNKPKKTLFLNASGPLTCLHCGKKFSEGSPNKKICFNCSTQYYCDSCNKIHSFNTKMYSFNNITKKVLVCQESLKNYWYDKNHKIVIKKEEMSSFKKMYMAPVVVFKDSKDLLEKANNIEKDLIMPTSNFLFKEKEHSYSAFYSLPVMIDLPKARYVFAGKDFDSLKKHYINDNYFFYCCTEEEYKNKKLNLIPLLEMEELNEHLCANSNSI